jgi:hypothetical protein
MACNAQCSKGPDKPRPPFFSRSSGPIVALRYLSSCSWHGAVRREEALPESIKIGGSVRKGTVLTFTRDHEGTLCARANEHDLITVQRYAGSCRPAWNSVHFRRILRTTVFAVVLRSPSSISYWSLTGFD